MAKSSNLSAQRLDDSTLYRRVFQRLPVFLRRRIDPLEYSIDRFVGSANTSADATVLDAGSGQGRFAHHFTQDLYIGLDLGVGHRNWDYSQLNLRADLAAIPLVSSSVDTVLNIQVLEHVPSPDRVLAEIHRVLRPGGHLYLTAPQGWHEHQQPHDYFRFTSFALQSLLERAGFQEIGIQPLGGYFHYLGHRLTYIPKILFANRGGWSRAALLPLELLSLVLFGFLAPILCFYLDGLDRKKEFTLGYRCVALKA